MRLSKLRVENFRSCYNTEVNFDEHLTLLVGENDGGKSNIIDALRLTIPPASGQPSLWFDADRDLSDGLDQGTHIAVSKTYADLTLGEQGIFAPVLIDDHDCLVHTTIYNTDREMPRRHRLFHRVGDSRLDDPEPENRSRIAHVYLPPLRDATRALDSSGGNRLADVFRAIVSQEDISGFEDDANSVLMGIATHPASDEVIRGVQRHLSAVTEPVERRVVDLKHRELKLNSLARSLRLHMAADGISPRDLLGSGLGYTNLLYMATVMLELERASEYDLVVLLVEEPEAHLHPQLQSVLLRYLLDHAEKSAAQTRPGLTPGGRIQVVATSHSPQLASSVSTRRVVAVKAKVVNRTEATSEELGVDIGNSHRTGTSTVALSQLGLSESDRRKVDRYLDATKASLLFARQVVLVEGIAESLLLRTLAEHVVFPVSEDGDDQDGESNRRSRNQFRAITVVSVGGVDFLPFLTVLLAGGGILTDRVVVITDGDGGAGERRQTQIESQFEQFVKSGQLVVCVGATTLEAELYSSVENEDALRSAFEAQHPRSLEKWDAIAGAAGDDPVRRGEVFSAHMKAGKLDLGKGDFAHVLSEFVRASGTHQLTVPRYLETAIRSAVVAPSDVGTKEPLA